MLQGNYVASRSQRWLERKWKLEKVVRLTFPKYNLINVFKRFKPEMILHAFHPIAWEGG